MAETIPKLNEMRERGNSQKIKQCRLCREFLPTVPFLKLDNIPQSVQGLPGRESLDADRGVSLEAYQCGVCGLVQLTTEPIVYYEGITSVTASSPTMLAHRSSQAREFVSRFQLKGKKALEVGCGDGHFLQILREEGVEAFGIEPSRKALLLARQKGLSVVEGYLSKGTEIPGQPFDAFVNFHVLEHVPDPNEFLNAIAGVLRQGAFGLVEVPSFEQILEYRRFYDFLLDHLSYFSQDTLRFALENNGFKVREIVRNWDGEHLVAFVERVGETLPQSRVSKDSSSKLSEIQAQVTKLRLELSQLIDSQLKQGKRVAVWGASLQGLTVLAVTGVKGIAYIVDSSPDKQGCFAPVSHFPIVAPERLRQDPPDVVIVVAPRYEREILDQLVHAFGFKGSVFTLHEDRLNLIKSVS